LKKLAIITTHPIQYQIPLFKILKKFGIEAYVFFASRHGMSLKNKDPEFLKKIKWNNEKYSLSGYRSFFSKNQKRNIDDFKLSFDEIENKLKKEKFEHILILGWNNLHYLKSFYYALKLNIKIILRVETNLKSQVNILKKIIKFIFLRFLFKNITYFLSIGKLNRQFYLSHNIHQKKIFPAPYFVDNKFFSLKITKNNIKKKFRLEDKKIILFVGKLIDRKNPIEFLKLAKQYQTKAKYHFIIIGDGYLKKDCKNFIKKNRLKNVSLKGFVNQRELRKYYKMSDLMIVTSLYETWGLVINEAFCFHVPVICTSKCGAAKDLIINGKTGYTYKSGNLNQLKNRLKSILNDKKLRKKMSLNIKNHIKKYSIVKTVESLLKIFDEK
tara:strand:+ start:206 stop:1354 length:1149 start_codon:yes stop_codon:yes gene_type:complete